MRFGLGCPRPAGRKNRPSRRWSSRSRIQVPRRSLNQVKRIGSEQTRPKLPALTIEQAIKAIQSSDPAELRKGAIALIQLGAAAKPAVPTAVEVLDKQPLDGPTDLLFVLSELGLDAQPAIPVLVKYTASSNFHARYLACRALGRIGEPAKPAVPTLIKMLDDHVASVRRNAAEALGRLGGEVAPEAVQPLMNATGDKLDPIREAAVLALGNFGALADPAIPLLKKMLQDEDCTVRPEAAQSLWLLKKDAKLVLPVLQHLLKHGESGMGSRSSHGRYGPRGGARRAGPDRSAQRG